MCAPHSSCLQVGYKFSGWGLFVWNPVPQTYADGDDDNGLYTGDLEAEVTTNRGALALHGNLWFFAGKEGPPQPTTLAFTNAQMGGKLPGSESWKIAQFLHHFRLSEACRNLLQIWRITAAAHMICLPAENVREAPLFSCPLLERTVSTPKYSTLNILFFTGTLLQNRTKICSQQTAPSEQIRSIKNTNFCQTEIRSYRSSAYFNTCRILRRWRMVNWHQTVGDSRQSLVALPARKMILSLPATLP